MRRRLILLCFILICLVFALPVTASSTTNGIVFAVDRNVDPSLTPDDTRQLGLDRGRWRAADGSIDYIAADYEGDLLDDTYSYLLDDGGRAQLSLPTPCDLEPHERLHLICRANVEDWQPGSYQLTVTLYSDNESVSYTTQLRPNEWDNVSIDIGTWSLRNAITGAELQLSSGARLQFLNLLTDEPMDEALRARFLTDSFSTQGGRIHLSPGVSMAYFVPTGNSPMLTATTLVPASQTETNALRFVFDNETDCRSVTLWYAYSPDGANARSLTHDVGEGRQICLFEVPDAARVRYIRIIFTGAGEGLITLRALNAVSIYENNITHLGTITQCARSENGREITVKGTVTHDVMIANRENCLALLTLEPWDSVDAALTDGRAPIATADISIRFSFTLPLVEEDYSALSAGYLVTIRSGNEADGYTYTPIADPQSLSVAYTVPEKADGARKGVQTDLVSTASQAGASIFIVDVYLDRLCPGNIAGYRYPGNVADLYFDRAILDTLDEDVRIRSTAGEDVYLRFLISPDALDVDFAIPQQEAFGIRGLLLDNPKGRDRIGAITTFLCDRYRGGTQGSIAGIIVGCQVDDAISYNDIGQHSLSDYVDHYGDLITLIANTARCIDPALQIIVPISDRRPAECITHELLENSYDSELFLRALFKRLDDLGGPPVSLMLESRHNPFSLVNGVLDRREEVRAEDNIDRPDTLPDYYNADALGDFSAMLDAISASYTTMPSTFLYCWTPDANTGDALSAAYAYLYYRLHFSTRAEAFIVSFAEAESTQNNSGMTTLRHLMKYIDTDRSLEVTESALAVFDAASWHELIIGFDESRLASRSWLDGELADANEAALGHYSYWNFTNAHSTRGWYAGTHIGSLAVSGIGKQRGLMAEVDLSDAEIGAYSEILYRFSSGEPLSLLDRLAFTLEIQGEGIWEVCISAGSTTSSSSKLEQKRLIPAGERVTLCLETALLEQTLTDYIKISCKPVSAGSTGRLCLYTVTGESDTLSDDELEEKLLELRLHDDAVTGEVNPTNDLVWLFVACAAVISTVAVALLLGRHQEEELAKEKTNG